MDDMQAIEQRISRELLRRAGPSEPVDDAAIFTAITTTQSPKWRFQSMFSATKFVVAGAIVALFGGFLLSGVLTQPSEDGVPSVGASASATTQAEPSDAATSEPEPTTIVEADASTETPDLLPGVDLVTEEVEPGVYRVLNDGIRDLSGMGRARIRGHAAPDGLAIGPDGEVWVLAMPSTSASELIRLGDLDSVPMTHGLDLRVDPEGTLWTHDSEHGIRRLGDDGLEAVAEADPFRGLWHWGIDAEGVVWALATNTLIRLEDGAWQEQPVELDPDALRSLGLDPDDDRVLSPPFVGAFGVDANGDRWAGLALTSEASPTALARHDGESWMLVDPLGTSTDYVMVPPRIGADGTTWVHMVTVTGSDEVPHLARFQDDRWTTYSTEDGVPDLLSLGDSVALMVVDHDGVAWMRPDAFPSDGISAFDGQTWTTHLEGVVVDNMAVAPDGNIWVLAADHLYVITPEAVAE